MNANVPARYFVSDNGSRVQIRAGGPKGSVLARQSFVGEGNRSGEIRADWVKGAVRGLKDAGRLAGDAYRVAMIDGRLCREASPAELAAGTAGPIPVEG